MIIIIKYIALFAVFFVAMLAQASFLPYFNILGTVPNIVFTLFFVMAFFESKKEPYEGFVTAVTAGFFLDIFVPSFFGVSIISLLAVYYLQKLITRVIKEPREKYSVYHFIPFFALGFVAYKAIMYGFSILFEFPMNVGVHAAGELLFSIPFAVAGFYVYKIFFRSAERQENQLKLL